MCRFRLLNDEKLRRQTGQRSWRSLRTMLIFFVVSAFIYLTNLVGEIVQSLVLAVAIANNANTR
jgi:hypothetical protein